MADSSINQGEAYWVHALRPMNAIATGKLGEMNYCLKIGQILARFDEAATESGNFPILIKDPPTATPRTRFCLDRQNLLEASVLNEEVAVPPPSNIPPQAVENARVEMHITVADLATHPDSTTRKINILNAHRAQFACPTSGAIQRLQYGTFKSGSRPGKQSVHLFYGQYPGNSWLQLSRTYHPWGGPRNQSAKVQEIEKDAERIQKRPECSRRPAQLCTIGDELLDIKMGGLRKGLRAKKIRVLLDRKAVLTPCTGSILLCHQPFGVAACEVNIECPGLTHAGRGVDNPVEWESIGITVKISG